MKSAIVCFILFASVASAAGLNDRPNCIRFGVPAVCHSDAVVNAATRIAAKRCPRKTGHHDWAVSLDLNEGPYGDPRALAKDVCMVAN